MADSHNGGTDHEIQQIDDGGQDLVGDDTRYTSTSTSITRTWKTKPFSNPVHQWFSDHGKDSKCIICPKLFAGRYPTTLKNHLQSHPVQYKEFQKLQKERSDSAKMRKKRQTTWENSSQPSIERSFRQVAERRDGWKKGSIPYEKAMKSIAIAWVANSFPYRSIDDHSIRKMFKDISDGRLINLPFRQELSTRINQLTVDLKVLVKSELKNAKYVSITLDLWSRPGYSSAMMGVTCHYFDRKAKVLQRALLACRKIQQPHTGENIHKLYEKIRNEWDLQEAEIIRIVTDNGANVVKAFKDNLLILTTEEEPFVEGASHIDTNLDEEDNSEDHEFDVNEADIDRQFFRRQRISCFAHIVMLAVKKPVHDTLEINAAQDKVSNLIGKFSASGKAMEELKKKPGGLGFIKPVRTRWIYWYYVFDRVIKIKRNICDVCEQLNIFHDLDLIDWKIVEEVRDVLKPFADVVKRLEGENYTTISEVYPMLYGLEDGLTKKEQQLQRLLRNAQQHERSIYSPILRLVQALLVELDQRFRRMRQSNDPNFDPIYVLATMLDPRWSLLLDGDLLSLAKRELKLLISNYHDTFDQEDRMALPRNLQPENERPQQNLDGDDAFAAAMAAITQRRRSNQVETPLAFIDKEIKDYLDELANSSTSESPFEFWCRRASKYPELFNIGVDILSIPATSAPTERIFSRASYILTGKRHNLEDEKLESELFYKVNMRFLN